MPVNDGLPVTARPAAPAAVSVLSRLSAADAVGLPQVPATVGTPAPAAAPPVVPTIFRAASAAVPAPAAATAGLTTAGPAASALAAANLLNSGSANSIGDFISGALLMFRRTFLNKAPTASATQALVRPSGTVFGYIAGSDPEGETLTYTLKKAPQHGYVTIDDYGVYTYIPAADFTGTDSFTVTVDTPGFHINLLNVLNPFGGSKKVVKIAVNANAADPAGTVADTFNGAAGSQPDPALWTINTGQWIDSGVQTYTNSTDNVRLDGQGNLVLEAHETPDGYTSGEVITQGNLDMTYGTMAARIKFPSGQGMWPAFWMLGSTYSHDTWDALGPTGWPGAGEIDVMELINTGTTFHVALHGPQASDGADYYGGSGDFVGSAGSIPDLTTDYHDYWVIRAPDLIVVGVDDIRLGTFTPDSLPTDGVWVFNQPMYAILNLAVGGSWPGPPDKTTPWPSTMLVDSFKYTPLS